MLFKSMYLLLAVGQARVVKEIAKRQFEDPINPVITSLNVLEGNGCPAGTYHPGTLDEGKSINAFVDFDNFVLNNSEASDDSLTCTLSIDYKIVYPASGSAQIIPSIQSHLETKDGKDTEFHLNYNVEGNLDQSRLKLDNINWGTSENGPDKAEFGIGLFSEGTAGETGTGSFKAQFSMSTSGPGSFQIQKIVIGFGMVFYTDE